MSDIAPTPEIIHESQNSGLAQKRKASTAGLAANGGRPAKAVKRRASKACQCCRARKVRCNVVEHGAPCTNCRLDEIECVVSESKRKNQPTFLPQLRTPEPTPISLPYYLKPIPSRIGQDELAYLKKKGALSVPDTSLRNELLRSYIEYCHPFMPLLDLHDFLKALNAADGSAGRVSFFLFSAVMFVGTAYVDFSHLQKVGYNTRKEARKDFFQKTRLLYDFDYEIDRISLVQGLLLMTYWYETPDDQKDTWHYMGLAISLAHTIGLHRNPDRSSMDQQRKKLWRRVWWSLYMRDRLIALGMRRPIRIKNEDYDVPMMTMDDFEIAPLPDYIGCVPADCVIARDVEAQRQLASMCIEKTKLCLCISQVLSTQYSVLNNNQGVLSDEGNTRTTMMLIPKKLDCHIDEIQSCDDELQGWLQNLPEEARYQHASIAQVGNGTSPIVLHRALLHLVFYCALSALHRPQVLPSMPPRNTRAELLEVSRRNVRLAANEITNISQNLHSLNLVRYLPTTGVTVLLPAIIIHLLDIKAPNEETRRSSLRGFCQCMQVMSTLRDNYAAADYSTAFLEAAIRKAEIAIPDNLNNPSKHNSNAKRTKPGEVSKPFVPICPAAVDNLVAAGHNLNLISSPIPPQARTLTPPPDVHHSLDPSHPSPSVVPSHIPLSDADVAARLNSFLASTPPDSSMSDHTTDASSSSSSSQPHASADSQQQQRPLDPVSAQNLAAAPIPNANANASLNLADTALFAASTMAPPGAADFESDFDSWLNVDLMLGGTGGSTAGVSGVGSGVQSGGMWGEWGGEDGGAGLAMQGESSGFTFDMDFMKGMGAVGVEAGERGGKRENEDEGMDEDKGVKAEELAAGEGKELEGKGEGEDVGQEEDGAEKTKEDGRETSPGAKDEGPDNELAASA
ncbi:MAG: hypothetical protein Q9165_005087 [Trypethelium subeluteriae]